MLSGARSSSVPVASSQLMAESPRGISPRGAHRSVLEPLGSHGSCHPQRAAALSATTNQFLLLPVDQVDHDANGLPPSLHGNYPASSLLWGSPNLNSAFVRSPSWFCHLWLLR